ncbi:hypothetical protein GDO78_015482 [Eleutherodactylus coqui]|uniref:Uncharacterized protein n=1 Tax=Eleutherodactylus coqui TaxID=57060 RepID=A0A8J6B734_ELECQ|nr:hypothetical protein GDO78_015482 [Eleutherodactylus coqui]
MMPAGRTAWSADRRPLSIVFIDGVYTVQFCDRVPGLIALCQQGCDWPFLAAHIGKHLRARDTCVTQQNPATSQRGGTMMAGKESFPHKETLKSHDARSDLRSPYQYLVMLTYRHYDCRVRLHKVCL